MKFQLYIIVYFLTFLCIFSFKSIVYSRLHKLSHIKTLVFDEVQSKPKSNFNTTINIQLNEKYNYLLNPEHQNRQWRTDEVHKLLELKSKGYSWLEISEELPNRSSTSCLQKYYLLSKSNNLNIIYNNNNMALNKLLDLVAEYNENWDLIARKINYEDDFIESFIEIKENNRKRHLNQANSYKILYKLFLKTFKTSSWTKEEVSCHYIYSKLISIVCLFNLKFIIVN